MIPQTISNPQGSSAKPPLQIFEVSVTPSRQPAPDPAPRMVRAGRSQTGMELNPEVPEAISWFYAPTRTGNPTSNPDRARSEIPFAAAGPSDPPRSRVPSPGPTPAAPDIKIPGLTVLAAPEEKSAARHARSLFRNCDKMGLPPGAITVFTIENYSHMPHKQAMPLELLLREVKRNNRDRFARYVEANWEDLPTRRDEEGRPLLVGLVLGQHMWAIDLLLAKPNADAHLRAQCELGANGLMHAVKSNKLLSVQRLLATDPKLVLEQINHRTAQGNALMFAALLGHLAVVQCLLQAPGTMMAAAMQLSGHSDGQENVLMYAAGNGHANVVCMLLVTARQIVSETGVKDVLDFLLDGRNSEGWRAVDMAEAHGHRQTVAVLRAWDSGQGSVLPPLQESHTN